MLKKSLGVLSGSLLLTTLSTPSFAVPFYPGSNAIVLFNTTGQGSYWMDSGVSADDIARNQAGFSLDISAATAALGGSIESFALIGLTSQTEETTFNYTEFLYVEPGVGILYAQSGPIPTTSNFDLAVRILRYQHLIANSVDGFGYHIEGSLGDIDRHAGFVLGARGEGGTFNYTGDKSGISLFHHYFSSDQSSSNATLAYGNFLSQALCDEDSYDLEKLEECLSFAAGRPGITIDSQIFSLEGSTFVTPIPGTAWLFLSALGGLMVRKRL